MSPLSHHDILRLARPVVEAGARVDIAACDRDRRTIAFRATEHGDARAVTTLQQRDDDSVELVRCTAIPLEPSGTIEDAPHTAIAGLSARVELDQLAPLVRAFAAHPPERQWIRRPGALAALDEVLLPERSSGAGTSAPAALGLRAVELVHSPLRLHIDASTSGGTPADLWLSSDHAPAPMRRATLASGALRVRDQPAARLAIAALGGSARLADEAALQADRLALLADLPDDLLAVAGAEFRILRWQGDHWKGALALPARGERRRASLDVAIDRAFGALAHLVDSPSDWHASQLGERWRVFGRRLKPLAALGAILAVMPIAWLAVSRGGVELHPLLLGITPLLMVFMIALSAREIPVMEFPPRPKPPPSSLLDALRSARDRSCGTPEGVASR